MWESSLYQAPVFYHGKAARRTDFLLVRCKEKVKSKKEKGQPAQSRMVDQLVVVPLKHMYVVGQQEPKVQVPPPRSKQFQEMVKERFKVEMLRRFPQRRISEDWLKKVYHTMHKDFPKTILNARAMKSLISEIGIKNAKGEPIIPPADVLAIRKAVTPDHCCIVESALASLIRLRLAGVSHKRFTDVNPLDNQNFRKVEEKFEKYFGYLARCETKFCTTTLKI